MFCLLLIVMMGTKVLGPTIAIMTPEVLLGVTDIAGEVGVTIESKATIIEYVTAVCGLDQRHC